MSNAASVFSYSKCMPELTSYVTVDKDLELSRIGITVKRMINRHSISLNKFPDTTPCIIGNHMIVGEDESYLVPVFDVIEFPLNVVVLNQVFDSILNDDIQRAYNIFQMYLFLDSLVDVNKNIGTYSSDIEQDTVLWDF